MSLVNHTYTKWAIAWGRHTLMVWAARTIAALILCAQIAGCTSILVESVILDTLGLTIINVWDLHPI